MTLGQRLRMAIKTLDVKNSREFARKFGIKEATLYAILSDKMNPTAAILKKISSAGIRLEFLINGEGEILKESQTYTDMDESDALLLVAKLSDGKKYYKTKFINPIIVQIFSLEKESIVQIYEILRAYLKDEG